MIEASSTVRLEVALRVLTTYCDLGKTATPEDEMNVRWWAGDEALSPPEAAAVVIRRELERDHAAGSVTAVETVPRWECVGAHTVGTGEI
jgi:hypothetical protein